MDSDLDNAKVGTFAVMEDVYGDGLSIDRRGISLVKVPFCFGS
jgi:hypothetical protein